MFDEETTIRNLFIFSSCKFGRDLGAMRIEVQDDDSYLVFHQDKTASIIKRVAKTAVWTLKYPGDITPVKVEEGAGIFISQINKKVLSVIRTQNGWDILDENLDVQNLIKGSIICSDSNWHLICGAKAPSFSASCTPAGWHILS